ncbi:MAG: pre-rRNA-processing protein esf1 [Thelocarpon impressellum]|nr:MAG: pre-rRNA-processing protein esf1 [Thelocarpon impressellum]
MSKRPRQKAPKGGNATASETITDPRFANIHTDPRFRLPSKKHTRVQLDNRFAHVLKDEDFSKKAAVDRYGRKLPKETGRKELERFYRLENDDALVEGEEDNEEADDDEEVLKELSRVEGSYDPARGGGFSSSEESSEDEEEAGEAEEEGLDFPDTQIDQQADVPMGEVSSRLAVVNLDWDNIRAVDLMAVFSSFCPRDGRIKKISVYPSEFGRERMEREEMEGPPREIFTSAKSRGEDSEDGEDEDEDEDDERIKQSLLREDKGEEFDGAKLRHYQLERLRYYYAVLTLSSPETAKALYDATDGTEYLTTANFFDLRFIPDEVSFDDDRPRDECTSLPDGYKPNPFVTDALQHSKVKLTWDAEDGVRKEAVKKAFGGSRADIEENDLKAYLGSDSSDEDEEVSGDVEARDSKNSRKETERQRLRAALGLSDAASTVKKAAGGPVGAMQITFSSGLSAADKKGSVFENEPVTEETTVQKYVRREKERKQRRKEKLRATREGATDASDAASAKTSTTAAAEGTEDDEAQDLGFDDPFFAAPADPSTSKAPKAKKSKADRLARREQRAADALAAERSRAELSLLMLPEPSTSSSTLPSGQPAQPAHFSIHDIARAEKAASKNRKPKHPVSSRAAGAGVGAVQEGFTMPVADPRFAAAFERVEFAIDPTNPRFSGTRAMNALLEEGRRRRTRKRGRDGDVGDGNGGGGGGDGGGESLAEEKKNKRKKTKKEGKKKEGGMEGDNLRALVEKVRNKRAKGA